MTGIKTARIIFAGGGTGGHLFPALAIADRVSELLKDKINTEIIFVGTKRGIEYRLKETLGYPLHIINMRGIARRLTLSNFLVPFIMISALMKAKKLINKFMPDLVMGTGGYVCWPVLKVASGNNIKTFLQEQNSFPGVTIRQLAGKADKIFLGFEEARQYLRTDAEIVISGNPVRTTINTGNRIEACRQFGLDEDKKTILVLGGSQGARAINQAVIKDLLEHPLDDNCQILWQTGKRDYTEVKEKAEGKIKNCSLFPFAREMELVYAAADIVVARAGALTLAEIIACGLPSLLIPYPYAAGDHQRKNAEALKNKNMALVIDESELNSKDIISDAIRLLSSDDFHTMKKNISAETANKKSAVDIIAGEIIEHLYKIKKLEQPIDH